ncbi:hypothetical protein SmJEL517_g04715 [Synchytrium microbalum]|uniref:Adenylyl cyclase-associated protein n=1 Tax=Synchytrium microbalum TaxID=1806994 RepID=A0A507C3M0_9FUNG|nr:uncharacterized protein SmJEL517_g04715 [Synchytrium microbalum]TPX32155.1 hypothetical protein SmJEL517_g04715 [Synchytrium microbalum]
MSEAALSSIIKRLESATVKLEEMASKGFTSASNVATSATTGTGASASGPTSAAVSAFDEFMLTTKTYVDLSAKIGGLVKEQADIVMTAFAAERRLIEIAAASKKPDQTTLQGLVKPLIDAGGKVTEIKDKNRASPLIALLSEVSEGISGLGWVAVEPAPAPFVGEYKETAQFWANKVIKEWRDKDKSYVDWANSFVQILNELQTYVKKCHTTGLVWNPKGGDAKSAPGSSAPVVAAAATTAAVAAVTGPALFSELNKEGSVTAGLRKVDKSEMTHKNPDLRATSVVPAAAVVPKAAPVAAAPTKPAKFALEGAKWAVENQVNNPNLVIDNADIKQSVYIYNCQNSTVQIKGKIKAVVLDNCKKVGVVMDTILSTADIVNCKSVQVQITGTCPTLNIDKTDGIQVFLSKTALGVEILTAKSSEMNVSFEGGADGDFVEKPIVEQFKTVIKNGVLITQSVEHSG